MAARVTDLDLVGEPIDAAVPRAGATATQLIHRPPQAISQGPPHGRRQIRRRMRRDDEAIDLGADHHLSEYQIGPHDTTLREALTNAPRRYRFSGLKWIREYPPRGASVCPLAWYGCQWTSPEILKKPLCGATAWVALTSPGPRKKCSKSLQNLIEIESQYYYSAAMKPMLSRLGALVTVRSRRSERIECRS